MTAGVDNSDVVGDAQTFRFGFGTGKDLSRLGKGEGTVLTRHNSLQVDL
ncbi:hypothetical protein GRAN_1442 [Granulicella sibirica]|uniref:Uncharacterized protein n=1 Tax=Granulicella sibirica TaxID=2479048 RepID=A0A4Q0T577_9BACT|nr:hypothetical protein GRAN_1442 [Granulicella sibirica]